MHVELKRLLHDSDIARGIALTMQGCCLLLGLHEELASEFVHLETGKRVSKLMVDSQNMHNTCINIVVSSTKVQ